MPRLGSYSGSICRGFACYSISNHALAVSAEACFKRTWTGRAAGEFLWAGFRGPASESESRRHEQHWQRNRFYTALVACARILQSFVSKNSRHGPPSLAAAGRGPSHSHYLAAASRHDSPMPESLAAARVTRHGPPSDHFGITARV